MVSTFSKSVLALAAIASTAVCQDDGDSLEENLKLIPNSYMISTNYSYPFNSTSTTRLAGIDLTGNFDFGANYELPMYSEAQYYITRQRFSIFLGGRQTISFFLTMLKLNFYLDIWPARFTFENYLSNDILGGTYDTCLAGFTYFDAVRFQLYFQLDYCELAYGVLGVLQDKSQ